jgi:predicted PurR-regulated permease PerM
VLERVSKSGLTLVGWLLNIVMIPVVAFYLLRDWDILVERIHALVPRSIEPTVVNLARESDVVLGAFLRGQISVMIALGILYAVGLWLVGLSVGPLIGMIAGLISFVPYLGAITGVVMAVIAALVQYQDWTHVALVLMVFGIGQSIEGYVLVPKLVGDKIGLHPVAVIFAVLAGGELFGFLGVLLALPVASVVMVLLRYAHERYTASKLYQSQDEPVIVLPGEESATPAGVIVTDRTPSDGP